MLRVLEVSRSGYFAWLRHQPGKWALENAVLLEKIEQIYKQKHGIYGSPRITHELNKKGFQCSRPRVARIMAKNNIAAKTKRKFKTTTNSKHDYSISPNLLKREFTVEKPNKVWTSDITYIRTQEGWLYLTVVLDLFNREIIGWSTSQQLTAETTTIRALENACYQKNLPGGVLFHSDRGCQYACHEFRNILRKNKMIQSMSGKGNCYDNAVNESFFHSLKTEWVYFENYENKQDAGLSIFEYIEIFYNRERTHSSLGYMSPIEFLEKKLAA